MTVDWKKELLPNLPYLLFVYLFNKLCQAVRLAPGLDASEKFLHLSQGFTEAFSSGLPSLHPLDLLAGIAGAVIVRLAVYDKGKNARKYRKGIEYGSARWGTTADIAPYVDPVPDWNIPLTQTEKLTMSSRPKNPKYARNKNILVIGGSGSGKTRFFVKPSLMQMHSSYVVTDPKGQLLSEVGTMLRRGAPKLDENGKPKHTVLYRRAFSKAYELVTPYEFPNGRLTSGWSRLICDIRKEGSLWHPSSKERKTILLFIPM